MRLVFVALLAAVVLFVGAARADEGEAAALQKFESGKTSFDAGSWAQALDAFKDSYKLRPSPNSRLYIARCYAKLGKVASAYVNYRFTAREANDRLVATGERRYALTRDAATEEGAELEPRVPRLTLAVPAGVPELVVQVNGTKVEPSAWGVAVETDPSKIVIDASGPRLKPFHVELTLAEGEQRRVDVLAERVPTAILKFRFASRPQGLAVALDGAPVAPDDFARPRDVDVGPHVVDATAPGYLPMHWSKDLADAERAEVGVELVPDPARQPSRGTPKWAFWAAGGASVVALGVGTYFGVRAFVLSRDETSKDPLARDPNVPGTIRTNTAVADVFLASGVILGAAATVLFFTTDWGPRKATVGVAPIPGGAGASVRASF